MLDGHGVSSKIIMIANWYTLCTKPRMEKKLRTMLQSWHIWNVLPTYVKTSKFQRRTVKNELPLFPGYIMARLDAAERLRVLKTNMTFAILPLPNARSVLRQLHQVVKAANATQNFNLVAPTVSGATVRVVSGPMKGLVGKIKTVDGKTLLTLNAEAFGCAVEVPISPEDCLAI